MKIDYSRYNFTKKELFLYILESLILCTTINYLFYKSLLAFLPMLPVPLLFLQLKHRYCIRRRKKELNYQFRDALSALCVALQAGYSVENAIIACTRDLESLYPIHTDILKEFQYMEAQMKVNVPIEELLMDLGNRSRIEDISNFSSVFTTAKRSGGDMIGILQKAARTLSDKIDIKKEIEATVAAKKSEQMIMSAMPFAIILYMQVTSPGFLQILYGNLFGIFTMSACLCIYFFAFWMGRRIVDIEV